MGLIFQVPQAHCVVIERFGKYARTVDAGLHFRLPFIERQKNVIDDCGWVLDSGAVACRKHGNYTYIELADQRINTAPRIYHTSDNVEVKIDAVIFWRIVEPRNAVYAVDNLIISLIDLSLNSMRSSIGQMTLDQLLSNRQQLNESTARAVSGTAQKWGISIQRVEIQELTTDQMTTDSMRKEMEAERKRRAAILEAEGLSKATVLQAEADKKAMILRAEGKPKHRSSGLWPMPVILRH